MVYSIGLNRKQVRQTAEGKVEMISFSKKYHMKYFNLLGYVLYVAL